MTRRGIESVQQQAAAGRALPRGVAANAEVVQTLGMADALLARWRQLNARGRGAAAARRRARTVALAALTRTAAPVGAGGDAVRSAPGW